MSARAYLEAGASEITEQVRLLDGVARYRFGKNAELMGVGQRAERSGAVQVEECDRGRRR